MLGYLVEALEGLREKLANIKASGRGEVAPRIIGDVITYVERLSVFEEMKKRIRSRP